jgi:hypothetical protein
MEETKYYTPQIEEFHVGFECECSDEETGFAPITICADDLKNKLDEEYNFQEQGNIHPEYRVKYLDRDDIESFGFKLWTYKGNEVGFMLNPDEDGSIWVHRIEGKIKISTKFPDTTLYLGKIKNKSALRVLLQQLEIV